MGERPLWRDRGLYGKQFIGTERGWGLVGFADALASLGRAPTSSMLETNRR